MVSACAEAGLDVIVAAGCYQAAAEMLIAARPVVLIDRDSLGEDVAGLTQLARRKGISALVVARSPRSDTEVALDDLQAALAEIVQTDSESAPEPTLGPAEPTPPPAEPTPNPPRIAPSAEVDPEALLTDEEVRALLEPHS